MLGACVEATVGATVGAEVGAVAAAGGGGGGLGCTAGGVVSSDLTAALSELLIGLMSLSVSDRMSRAIVAISRYVRFPNGQYMLRVLRAPMFKRIRSRSICRVLSR